ATEPPCPPSAGAWPPPASERPAPPVEPPSASAPPTPALPLAIDMPPAALPAAPKVPAPPSPGEPAAACPAEPPAACIGEPAEPTKLVSRSAEFPQPIARLHALASNVCRVKERILMTRYGVLRRALRCSRATGCSR